MSKDEDRRFRFNGPRYKAGRFLYSTVGLVVVR